MHLSKNLVWQSQNAFGNNVELNLTGAAFDRVGFTSKPGPRLSQFFRLKPVALLAQHLYTDGLDHQLQATLVLFRPIKLKHGGNETRRLGQLAFSNIAPYR